MESGIYCRHQIENYWKQENIHLTLTDNIEPKHLCVTNFDLRKQYFCPESHRLCAGQLKWKWFCEVYLLYLGEVCLMILLPCLRENLRVTVFSKVLIEIRKIILGPSILQKIRKLSQQTISAFWNDTLAISKWFPERL